MKASDDSIWEFGAFRLDAREHVLLRAGTEICLTPKVFDALVLLVRRSGELLDREGLLRMLWPGTIVTDATLTQTIWLLRKALGDVSEGGELIETVPRVGYRFVGAVRRRPRPAGSIRSPEELGECYLHRDREKFRLVKGENVVGRDPDAAFQVDLDTVSRRHARILLTGDTAVLEDLGSKNGTFVRGMRIGAPTTLADRDVILLGEVALLFRTSPRSATTRSAVRRPGRS